jgi:bifunctional NMN adenylyltransferase/nudix hydrolase
MHDYAIFIGRFQPFHNAHKALLEEALNVGKKVVIVLGSYNKSSNIKNPWTGEQRKQMILDSISKDQQSRISFILMRDYLYNDNLWVTALQEKISTFFEEESNENATIALVGHNYDASSFYLKLFPQWKFINVPHVDDCPHATSIRNMYFTYDNLYKKFIPEGIHSFLEEFQKSEQFKHLKEEFDYLSDYHRMWEGAPFPPTFVTTDNIVIKSGHVLLVKRRCNPGKGLYALPGGFLSKGERIKDGAIRELKEETGIALSKTELENHIVESKIFDHPERSLRGRTITHAYLYDLKYGPLPKVKGMDDAEKALWMPIADILQNESLFFEDHWHIIFNFVNRL